MRGILSFAAISVFLVLGVPSVSAEEELAPRSGVLASTMRGGNEGIGINYSGDLSKLSGSLNIGGGSASIRVSNRADEGDVSASIRFYAYNDGNKQVASKTFSVRLKPGQSTSKNYRISSTATQGMLKYSNYRDSEEGKKDEEEEEETK